MKKLLSLFDSFVGYRISLKELYFSFTTWFVVLVVFLGLTTKFSTGLWIANIAIGLCVYLIIVLVLNRIILSGFLTLLLAVSFDYIKLIKWQFLMQDFSAADFFMLKLLINHGLFRLIYEYATKEIYLIVILLIINFVLMWNKYDTLLERKKLGVKHFLALRIVCLGVAILFASKLADLAFDKNSYFSHAANTLKVQSKGHQRRIYGPFADVLFTLQDIYIRPNKGEVDESLILERAKKEIEDITKNMNEMPDIIVILNESVFDPSKLDYDFADDFKFEFFQDNKYTKYSGIMNVNTFGGSSWISEYEVNTGIPHKSFAGPSYMPFITLSPRTNNSMMSHLRSLGYQVEVVYPVDKDFSLAQEAYTSLGAHKITDIYEYGFEPESWGGVPDTMISEMIINTLDKNPEKPKYIFASTMLNHGPHSSYFPDEVGCSRSMNDKLCSKLNDYLSRMQRISRDQSELIKKLMKRKRKTIIVNFGDHLPSFEGFSTQLRFTRDIKDYFKTFYNIHANFEIADKTKYKSLDIFFIPSLVLDIAGLNNNDYYKSSSVIRNKCNGQMANCSDNSLIDQKLYESFKSLITKQLGF